MNKRLAWYCVAYAILLGGITWRWWPFTAPLSWPMLALLWLALGYGKLGPQVWGKRGKGMRRFFMLPLHLTIRVWHRVSSKNNKGPAELVPGLWLGRRLSAEEAARWLPPDVAVLDLSPEYAAGWARQQTSYLAIDILEGDIPTLADLVASQLFIDLNQKTGVFICCAKGSSRCALIAAAWLLRRNSRVTVERASDCLKSLRPEFKLHRQQRVLLEQFRTLYHT